jgi:hypothetical protein
MNFEGEVGKTLEWETIRFAGLEATTRKQN